MASRKAQKEAARERRLAEERARQERERRTRRLRMVGGVVVTAIAVVAVAIAVSSGGNSAASVIKPDSPAAKKAQASVNTLLQGIPQQGNTLGSPSAKVTVTEFGDLECPVCKSFALGAENQLIANEVRSGKVKLVYRSLETASSEANSAMFIPQQAAALAAGQQKLGWNFIELFYHEQGDETSSYVTDGFLGGLAKQVSGLNFNQWSSDRQSSSFTEQVNKDTQAAAAQGFSATPTIVVTGPKSQAKPIESLVTYPQLQSAIKSVS
jgi:protein-disulfide isomerase